MLLPLPFIIFAHNNFIYMGNYIVSALKYRPATFDSVVGQKALTTTLKNAIITNKLAHAYLFCGPRGVGKTTCARIFAKTINCTNLKENGEACNECESCKSFNEQHSLNIYELDAASNNSVEDIRNLIEQVRIPPQVGKYKVYIIDEVHMLSQAAFNAFLKTLEEPPRYVIFILATTEKHKVLPTILSRCQIYDFNRIGVKDIVEYLSDIAQTENIKADKNALNIIAKKADGGMRDALSIFDMAVSFTDGNITYDTIIENLNILDYDYYFKLTDILLENKVNESLLLFNEILEKGFEGNQFIDGLAIHFRDLLVAHDAETVQLLEVEDDIRENYLKQSRNCSIKFLYQALKLCNDCSMNYRTNKNKRLLVELTLIELAQITDENSESNDSKTIIKPIKAPGKQADNNAQNASHDNKEKSVIIESENSLPETNTTPQNDHKSITELLKTESSKSKAIPIMDINALSVSIKKNNKLDKEENDKDSKKEQQETIGEDDFNYAELHLQLINFAHSLPIEYRSLSIKMPDYELKALSKTHYEILVDNDFAAKEIESIKAKLIKHVRNELNNRNLNLTIRVSEIQEKKKPIGRKEKFDYLAQKNKSLIELQKKFELGFS